MMEQLIDISSFLYNYCTDFVINLANLLGLSYYEVNVLIFIVLWPVLTVTLLTLFFVYKLQITKLNNNNSNTQLIMETNRTKESSETKLSIFLMWLFFSPVLLFIRTTWKSIPKFLGRLLIIIVSPFTIFFLTFGFIFYGFASYYENPETLSPQTINRYSLTELEKQIGVDIPGYTETSREGSTVSFQGDWGVSVNFNYDYTKKNKLFRSIENEMKKPNNYWVIEGEKYKYFNWDLHNDGDFVVIINMNSNEGEFSFGQH